MKNILYTCLFLFCCFSMAGKVPTKQKQRLTENWEYLKGDLGGIWEAVRHSRQEIRNLSPSGRKSLYLIALMLKTQ